MLFATDGARSCKLTIYLRTCISSETFVASQAWVETHPILDVSTSNSAFFLWGSGLNQIHNWI